MKVKVRVRVRVRASLTPARRREALHAVADLKPRRLGETPLRA